MSNNSDQPQPKKKFKQGSLSSFFCSPPVTSTPAVMSHSAVTSAVIKSSSATLPPTGQRGELPPTPNQPTTIVFPVRRFSKETFTRSCKAAWFTKWPWLHYDAERDDVLCFSCAQAEKRQLTRDLSSRDNCFISDGFTNWKKASESFSKHEKSCAHKEAAAKLIAVKDKPIDTMLSKACGIEQTKARSALILLCRSIRFLGRQGLPLQGDDHRDGVLWQLMFERAHDRPELSDWLKRRNNWMSNTIQNEIINMFGSSIQRHISEKALCCAYYGITADGTTDSSGQEQFSISIQFCDENLEVQNKFLGFYNAPDSTAQTLASVIQDVLLRLNLPIDRLQGYCFDGASNMSGHLSGVQARLNEKCPDALYVHCANHSLDLVLQEAARDVRLITDVLSFVREASNTIRESSKRRALYNSLFGDKDVVRGLQSLCPTRWCVRASAVKRVIESYQQLSDTLVTLSEDRSVRNDSRAKIAGLANSAGCASTYFGLLVCAEIFVPCEAVAKNLQGVGVTALGANEAATILISTMQTLRSDEKVQCLLQQTRDAVVKFDLDMPIRRVRKTTSRYRHTDRAEDVTEESKETTEAAWRRGYYEAVDLISQELKRRFSQTGINIASQRERLLIDASSRSLLAEPNLPALPSNIDARRLRMQLMMLHDLCQEKSVQNVASLAAIIASAQPETRRVFKEVEQLVRLCLCLPVSVAGSERSFSALRRLKTWLRNTMTQCRLTNLALMHIHADILDLVDMESLVKDFCLKTAERRSVFGQ